MKLFKENVCHYRYDCSLEEYICSLNAKCGRYAYKPEIRFIGSVSCEIDLKHEYSFWYHSSFRPSISATVESENETLNVTYRYGLPTIVKVFLIAMGCLDLVLMIDMLRNYFTAKQGEFGNPLTILFPLASWIFLLLIFSILDHRTFKNVIPEGEEIDQGKIPF